MAEAPTVYSHVPSLPPLPQYATLISTEDGGDHMPILKTLGTLRPLPLAD